MAKVKVQKKDTFIDMTAMSDVTVLLLTFFMLSASFKPAEPVEVITPASVSEIKVQENYVMTILVDKGGKIFLNMDRPEDKAAVLLKMGEDYRCEKFSKSQIKSFVEQTHVGVPMNMMFDFLNKPMSDQNDYIKKNGVPVDSIISKKNELASWVRAYKEIRPEASIAIKADRETPYTDIDDVMRTLVDIKENRYSLVTTLRAMPEGL